MAARKVPASQKQNVRKQMQQLSYSTTQAKEFSDAARSGGDTTRALLAYYSITALANVEILWRGSADENFERRPSHYNGHGLEIVQSQSLWDFGARPQLRNDGSVSGLFGLWRRFASHFPLYCEWMTASGDTSRTTLAAGISGRPLEFFSLPNRPLTLGECLKHIPSLAHSTIAYGEQPQFVRGRNEVRSSLDSAGREQSRQIDYILHPASPAIFDTVLEFFRFNPSMAENLRIQGGNGGAGAALRIEYDVENPPWQDWGVPEVFSERRDLYYMVGPGAFLNEFGYFYIGLYITGMVSRYYPHHWIKQLREGAYVTSLVQEFVEHSLQRAPMLVLGQLEQTIFLYD
ncbi:YaaC family protein [Rhizobium sp. LEGMi12c]